MICQKIHTLTSIIDMDISFLWVWGGRERGFSSRIDVNELKEAMKLMGEDRLNSQ